MTFDTVVPVSSFIPDTESKISTSILLSSDTKSKTPTKRKAVRFRTTQSGEYYVGYYILLLLLHFHTDTELSTPAGKICLSSDTDSGT